MNQNTAVSLHIVWIVVLSLVLQKVQDLVLVVRNNILIGWKKI